MRRDYVSLPLADSGSSLGLLAYGHYGRPLLVFPSEQGHCHDYEDSGMIAAVAGLLDAGRVKVYAVDSLDTATWFDTSLSLEERARRHSAYERWVLEQAIGFIRADCGPHDVAVTGCSFGAFHAANFALKRADLFPTALCLSGVYDAERFGWGERGDALYFDNPMAYVANLHGDHLAWLRSRVHLILVCGQGQWEDSTGALASTRAFAGLLVGKAIPHQMDLWGHDVPHDWPSWRRQLAHHLPRLC